MAKSLKVDPIDLHASADHLNMHHADLRTAHGSADADIEDAQTGWVGASAAALQAKFAEWQATTEQLCGTIADHEQAIRTAAAQYQKTDEHGGRNIDGAIP